MKTRISAAITAASLAITVTACGASSHGFQNTATLQNALKGIVAKRLANRSGPYYLPGVHVTRVLCVEQSATSASCVTSLSDGSSTPSDVVIAADGDSFVTK
jgi:hypothetical protein